MKYVFLGIFTNFLPCLTIGSLGAVPQAFAAEVDLFIHSPYLAPTQQEINKQLLLANGF